MKYCRLLKFEDRPDYCWLKRLFKDLFFKIEKDWDLVFDWNKIVQIIIFFNLKKKINR